MLRSEDGPVGLSHDGTNWKSFGGSLIENELSVDADPLASVLKWKKNRDKKSAAEKSK